MFLIVYRVLKSVDFKVASCERLQNRLLKICLLIKLSIIHNKLRKGKIWR